MAFFDFIKPVMEFLFGWVLVLPPFWAILLISFLIALLITFCYKWFTNQDLMKQLKEEMKAFQKEIKELKAEPEKAMAVQKKAMETNMKYMMQSLKPTLITFIPIILIFGWLQGAFAYEPLMPGTEFSVSMQFEKGVIDGEATLKAPEGIKIVSDAVQTMGAGQASWTLKGEKEGEYFLEFTFNDRKFSKKVLITQERTYEEALTFIEDPQVKSVSINYEKLIIMDLLGWELGWLGSYIIFSILFSLGLRKAMKLY
ncbi:DUF106 domain-containing protein [Candidatus Woesearchaeota archaeon]|nr:DUF106 domain-containing protein [Candidatus Woesearchaeota archaeon]